MKKQLLTLIALMAISSFAFAQKIEREGIYYNITSSTAPRTVEVVSKYATYPYNDADTYTDSITIPSSITDKNTTYSVTAIGKYAFSESHDLLNVAFGDSVISIGNSAFQDCISLTSMTIGDSVTAIGLSAFSGCSALTNVTIGNSVTVIEINAFRNCSSLASVIIGNSVRTIGNSAFQHCSSLTSVTIPNSVRTIGNSAFYDCSSLSSVTIGDSVASIGNSAFSGCNILTSITLSNLLTTIGERAFSECSALTSIVIPDLVTTIGERAFYSCDDLASITLGRSVTSIGNSAFSGCSDLTELYVKLAKPLAIDSTIFQDVPDSTVLVYVPCQSVTAYQEAAQWKKFKNIEGSEELSVTVESNNIEMGTVEIVEISCENKTAVIQATANENYHFVRWDIGDANNVNTLAQRSIKLDSVVVYTAIFAINTHTITVTVQSDSNTMDMGTVTGSGSYDYNSEAIITATANEGYHFVQWSDGNTDNPRTIVVVQDSIFTAKFAEGISIAEIVTYPYQVFANNRTLIIKQAEGQTLTIFDVMGRCIFQTTATAETTYTLPTTGLYIVRIGERFVKKVIVN